jgi:hypothetical protein
MDNKILLEKYIKVAVKKKLQEEEQAIKRAEKSLYLIYRFPKLKEAIESLLTPAFGRYLSNITVVAPKPTTFNVELINSLDFQLMYSRGGFFAKISGKKYDLAMGNAVDRACAALTNLLSLSPALKEEVAPSAASVDSVSGAEAPKADAGEEAFKDLSGAGTPPPETPAETPPPPAEA